MTEEHPPRAARSRAVPILVLLAVSTVAVVVLWLRGNALFPTFGDVIAALLWIGAALALVVFILDENRARRAELELEARRFGRETLVGEHGPEIVRVIPRPPYDQDREG